MAHGLVRDPEFRAEMQQLLRAAFHQTLKELREGGRRGTIPPSSARDGAAKQRT